MKSEKGITMISLAITIVILMVLSGIGVNYGIDIMRKAENESIKTNMLLIKAKAKEYQEEVDFKSGIDPEDTEKADAAIEEVYVAAVGLEKIAEVTQYLKDIGVNESFLNYYVTEKTFEQMGLTQIEIRENEKYIISFDETEKTIEIFSTIGTVVERRENEEKILETKYSLTSLEE